MASFSNYLDGPELVWVTEPENKIRFRYESEGGSHGGLAGKAGKKTYPTLKLKNYHGRKKIIVRVSLYTEDKKEHVLEFKGKKNEGSKRYIEEILQDDNTVVFKNLHILSKKKDAIEQVLMDRRLKNLKDGMSNAARTQFERKYSKDVKERARAILNSVRLYFEVFEETSGRQQGKPLCTLFSDVISNQKAASKGELRIVRLSQVYGSYRGGDEIILLCEKVQKDNIKVKFYETNENGDIIWQEYGVFSPLDVHYQVAIPFKTPPYIRNEERKVFICLERNDETSDPREFTYKSDEEPSSKKRKLNMESGIISMPDTPESIPSVSSPENSNVSGGEMQGPSYPFSFPSDHSNQFGITEEMDLNPTLINEYIELLNGESCNLPFDDLIDPLDMCDESSIPFQDDILYPQMYTTDSPVKHDERIVNHSLNMISIDVGIKNLSFTDVPKRESVCLHKFKDLKNISSDLQQKKKVIHKYLLKKDDCNNTLLHMAVLLNKNIIPILKMSRYVNIDLTSIKNHKKQTPLHIAVEKNNCKDVKFLLKYNSNPNLKDSNGNNCYHLAAKQNFSDVIQEINKFSRFPHNVNDFNDDGLTPIHIAVMQKTPNLFNLLKIHVTDSNIVEKKSGKSILHYVINFQPSLLSTVLEMDNIDVNLQDFEGNTPLHVACANENVEAVKKLIQSHADPSIKNFKQNFGLLDIENSDDTSDGQLPADLTTNLEILKLLSAASDLHIEDSLYIRNSANFQEPDEMQLQMTEKLCAYLDDNMNWKKLALLYFDEDDESLMLGCSPGKTLLNLIKKEHQENYLERLRTALEIADLRDALNIITEYQLKEITDCK